MQSIIKSVAVLICLLIGIILTAGCERDKAPLESDTAGAGFLENTTAYETFLDELFVEHRNYYFGTANPGTTGGFVWIKVYQTSPLASVLMDVYNRGVPVRVWLGEPYTVLNEQPCATVYAYELLTD
ncbi:hypothetical protein JW948_07380 [bacterium]|nr:hypothetical protein [bacterium]